MRIQVQRSNKGFSLLEVLVSLCILSVGILGAAAMQMSALHTTQQAAFHTMALQLATELADQLRNHPDDVSKLLLQMDFEGGEQISMASQCWGDVGACDSMGMAAFSNYEAQRRLKTMLPQGRIKICRDAKPWGEQEIAYRWDCDDSDSDAPIVVKLGWRDPAYSKIKTTQSTLPPKLVLQVQS